VSRQPEPGGVEAVPRSLWEQVRADPERAPEHIALVAAERFAPAAERWAAARREEALPAELARTALRTHVRASRLEGAAAGLGGAFTIVPDLAALAWIQGRMVFFIAAAHGFDAGHPMRPAELLALQGVYSTPAEARAALDGMGRPMAAHYVASRGGDQRVALRLLKLVGRKAAKRVLLKAIPVLSSPLSAVENARVTSELGARAMAYYGG